MDDVVGTLIQVAEHPRAVGEVYNIGSDHEVTILELARKIKKLTGSESRIVFKPYDEAYEEGFEDMMRRVPDISKIRALVGYKPRADLNDILASVIDYHRLRMLNEVGVPAGSLVFQLS